MGKGFQSNLTDSIHLSIGHIARGNENTRQRATSELQSGTLPLRDDGSYAMSLLLITL
jgi:hypothetical protein